MLPAHETSDLSKLPSEKKVEQPLVDEKSKRENEEEVGAAAVTDDGAGVDERRRQVPITVGGYTMRALLDIGAACTLMGPIALQVAQSLHHEIRPLDGRRAKLPARCGAEIVGYATLPRKVQG